MTRGVLALLALLLGLSACGGKTADGAAGAAPPSGQAAAGETVASDRAAALTWLVDEVVVPAHAEQESATTDLASAAATLCRQPSGAALDQARESWRAAMSARAAVRPVTVGASMERTSMAQLDWPADPDQIAALLDGDEEITREALDNGPAGRRGLLVLEVVLFGDGSETLATGDERRCAYAETAAARVAAEAGRLRTAFQGEEADRLTGRAATSLSAQGAIDEVVNTHIRVLDDLVDARLDPALPAETVEGPAGHGAAWAAAALQTLQASYDDEGLGGQLPEPMRTGLRDELEAAAAATEQMPDGLAAAKTSVRQAAHEHSDAVRVAVRTDVVSVLDVIVNFSDNDGDSG